ncbi:MAG: hypothetical protein MUF03_01895 [Rubrivivax sp.]|jgi:hypothetical protein|nr:hypothetical protein [Rubrivivax sp.]
MLLVDIVLAVTLVEALVLLAYHRWTGRGLAPRDWLAGLAAGVSLLLALRVGLSGGGAVWIGAALTLSGLAHAADLRLRWRSR